MVSCITPAALATGSVVLELATDEIVDITTESKTFVYERGATVESVKPSAGSSETGDQTITVFGQHFDVGE